MTVRDFIDLAIFKSHDRGRKVYYEEKICEICKKEPGVYQVKYLVHLLRKDRCKGKECSGKCGKESFWVCYLCFMGRPPYVRLDKSIMSFLAFRHELSKLQVGCNFKYKKPHKWMGK